MKNTDIALVVLIAAVSVGVSYWLGNLILGDPSEDTYKVSYVDVVDANINEPDVEVFNPHGLNPTVEVIIGKCKEGEKYDKETRRCVEDKDKNKKEDNGGDSNPDENPDNPSPDVVPEE